jgi:hypothetical protein
VTKAAISTAENLDPGFRLNMKKTADRLEGFGDQRRIEGGHQQKSHRDADQKAFREPIDGIISI